MTVTLFDLAEHPFPHKSGNGIYKGHICSRSGLWCMKSISRVTRFCRGINSQSNREMCTVIYREISCNLEISLTSSDYMSAYYQRAQTHHFERKRSDEGGGEEGRVIGSTELYCETAFYYVGAWGRPGESLNINNKRAVTIGKPIFAPARRATLRARVSYVKLSLNGVAKYVHPRNIALINIRYPTAKLLNTHNVIGLECTLPDLSRRN